MIHLISGKDSKLVNRVTAVLSHNILKEDIRVVNTLVLQVNHAIVCSEFANSKESLQWHRILTNWRHLNITVFIPTTRHYDDVSRFIKQCHITLVQITHSDADYIYGTITNKIMNEQLKLLITREGDC